MCYVFSSFLLSFFPFSFENISTPICNGIQKHHTFSSWQNNSIVPGVIDFFGKIFLEKIPRVPQNMKKLYLFVRAKDYEFANQRFHIKVLEVVNKTLCQYFQGLCLNLNRKVHIVMRLADLYLPYLFFNGIFDDMNTKKLLLAAKQGDIEMDLFDFDPQIIDWEDYFMNIHIPGIFKYALK